MRIIKNGLIVVLLLMGVLLSGCIPTGQSFAPVSDMANNKAVIYLYRPFNMVGGARMYTVWVDHQEMGKLSNGAYEPFLVDPGDHTIELKEDVMLRKGYEFEVTVQSVVNKTRYLRFGSDWAGGKAKLKNVDASIATPELEKCKKY